MKNRQILILITGLGLIFTVVFLFKTFQATSTPESISTPIPTSTMEENSQSKTYTSQKLGVTFNYKPDYFNDDTISVKESGNKIYVFVSNRSAEDGQYLEEFSKDPSDSLEQAIKKQFLEKYSGKDCFVEILKNDDGTSTGANSYPDTYQKATISYPAPTDPSLPFFANADKCPKVYSATNGISYFLYDTNHPNKYLFLSIGQYAIESGLDNQTWQATIRVIK